MDEHDGARRRSGRAPDAVQGVFGLVSSFDDLPPWCENFFTETQVERLPSVLLWTKVIIALDSLHATQKHVALTLAPSMDATTCYTLPRSVASIARDATRKRQTVRNALDALRRAELLTVIPREDELGGSLASVYVGRLPAAMHIKDEPLGQGRVRKVLHLDLASVPPSDGPSNHGIAVRFEDRWPRHRGGPYWDLSDGTVVKGPREDAIARENLIEAARDEANEASAEAKGGSSMEPPGGSSTEPPSPSSMEPPGGSSTEPHVSPVVTEGHLEVPRSACSPSTASTENAKETAETAQADDPPIGAEVASGRNESARRAAS